MARRSKLNSALPLTPTIGIAHQSDAEALWALRARALSFGGRDHYSKELLQKWTGGTVPAMFNDFLRQDFYVAWFGDRIVGSGCIDLGCGKLDFIFVDPDWMGRGVGRQILTHLETLAEGHELKQLSLDATLNAASFYRELGFVGDKTSIYESPRGISIECIPMTKALLPFRSAETRTT